MAKYLCTCGHSRWEHKNGFKECCVSLMPNNTCTCKSFNQSVKEAHSEPIKTIVLDSMSKIDELQKAFLEARYKTPNKKQEEGRLNRAAPEKPFELTDFDRSLLKLYSISAE